MTRISSSGARFLRTCYPFAASESEGEPEQLDRSDIDDIVILMRQWRNTT
jgi:hypothetical protein